MTRQFLFQIRWFLGITAGLVLAVMGVSGAAISFTPGFLLAMNRDVMTTPLQNRPRLSLDQPVARAQAQHTGARVQYITLYTDPTRNPQVTFEPLPDEEGDGDHGFMNPYTGRLLGQERGIGVVVSLVDLHTSLTLPVGAPGWGKLTTGSPHSR